MDEYENFDLIGNARSDSVIYDLAPAPTGKKGSPAKHGRRLSIYEDFELHREWLDTVYPPVPLLIINISYCAMKLLPYKGRDLFRVPVCQHAGIPLRP